MILLDCNVLFRIQALEKETILLSIDADSNYYKQVFPHIACTIFKEHPEDPDHELLAQVLNTAVSVIEGKSENYSFIDDTVQEILKNLLDTQQSFCSVIVSNYKKKEIQSEYVYLMQQVLLYLNEHYDQKLSLADLAARNLLSDNYLSHLMKKISGKTFKELVAYVRCIKSERYLIQSDWKINEVSYEVGFSLPAYYKNSFLNLYGAAPQEFRELVLENSGNKAEPVVYSQEQAVNTIKAFAHKHHIQLASLSSHIFSVDSINIDKAISKYISPLSEKGEIRNINSEINESTQQAFVNMQKEFRMRIITIDGDTILTNAMENSGLTVIKNIDYLINSGFDIGIVLRRDSPRYVSALIDFLTFYSRRFKNTLKYISFYLEFSADKQQTELFEKQLSKRLFDEFGTSFQITIWSQDKSKFKCAPFLYDSFVLTPFAMDELFHFRGWPGELAFSLIDSVNKNGNIMAGGNGLLTWNGIKKPWWNAYRLASKLRGDIISEGADHIVTNDNGDIVILTYNLCGFSPGFLKAINTKEKLYELIQKKNQVREHHFQLDNIRGDYKVIRFSINPSSCLFSKWAKLGYPAYLTSEEEQIIAETSHPEVDFEKLSIDGKLKISTVEESFGVSCVVLEKL
ncbi:AraC family transcriptional regulator [Anaerovorax odorimutans]|uniref:AraC family transcriptional regulator n=2 Tax=Anaerovorax odorimutans TaxID=109327 RepID=A0ABT1RR00_9FIRM|nr:AraC family transcriptional regulator [Anaerovorax odorimutans]